MDTPKVLTKRLTAIRDYELSLDPHCSPTPAEAFGDGWDSQQPEIERLQKALDAVTSERDVLQEMCDWRDREVST